MNPITDAARRLVEDAEKFWYDSPYTLLPLVAHEDCVFRRDLGSRSGVTWAAIPTALGQRFR